MMVAALASTINTSLPSIPETDNPELFKELMRVYSALNNITAGVDEYTADGTLKDRLEAIAQQVDSLANTAATLTELKKKYLKYTVPKFTVVGKFACNGQIARVAFPITKNSGTASGGGAGTAAGGFATAGDRDAAVSAINANAAAITEIQNLLKSFGLGV